MIKSWLEPDKVAALPVRVAMQAWLDRKIAVNGSMGVRFLRGEMNGARQYEVIEWEREPVATADEADAIADALQEAARIYRRWEQA